jgi:methylated-DNA-[protein]-cysteine S-methyltransferase
MKNKPFSFISTTDTTLGKIYLASDGEHLSGLWFEGQKHFPLSILEMEQSSSLDIFKKTNHWLELYFNRQIPDFTPALKPKGTDFRHRVWDILLEIPYGEIFTYGDIAKKLNMNCARAVGGAVGHNPISIIIPCHRVVGANGSLTGYSGGIGVKVRLLELEGADMSKLFVPKKGSAL